MDFPFSNYKMDRAPSAVQSFGCFINQPFTSPLSVVLLNLHDVGCLPVYLYRTATVYLYRKTTEKVLKPLLISQLCAVMCYCVAHKS